MKIERLFPIAVLCLVLPAPIRAQTVENFAFSDVNLDIPDGRLSGTSDTRAVTSAGTSIQDVQVSFDITGGPAFNGDLYVYLLHDSGFAVLLNRPGRTSGNIIGYGDNGLDVTFSDAAVNGDIHNYRVTLFGNSTTPVDPAYQAPLTGLWAPDGRNVQPSLSYDTTPRSAILSSFNGLNPSGTWTLFLADTSAGGTAVLSSWALSIQTIPEPGTACLLLCGAGLLGFRACRPRRRGATHV